ncbi:MAG: glycosyltransferase [Calditrichaeota bacterium]|nr:MAG: glycosyltransferase [Calditrichota bacterium]
MKNHKMGQLESLETETLASTLIEPIPAAFVSTYPPRRCGIATFTHDLISSIAKVIDKPLGQSSWLQVVALNHASNSLKYPHQVRFEIRDQQKTDYREAADFINVSPVEIVSLQHEYGIFGGDDGIYILGLLKRIKKPVVTTLHTVLQRPSQLQFTILKEICQHSTRVVVLSKKAAEILQDIYGVDAEKISFIHHGVPDVPFLDSAFYKDQLDLEGRLVMLTFGLINPNKGIEVALDALARIVPKHPEVAYVVLGATHPEVKRRFGEEYRLFLNRKVKDKGMADHVIFHNRFVTNEELVKFLIMSDIYLTPYLSKEQIASGTLAYAIGCGKAIISTPYWYAEEMLAEDRGRLVPFKDAEALADAMEQLIVDEIIRNRLRKNAYTFGREMIWRQVAINYLQTFNEAIEQFAHVRYKPTLVDKPLQHSSLPEIKLKHLKLLTDDTGMLQHANYTTPARIHGYTTDDNARALLVMALHWHLFSDDSIIPLFQTYLSFLDYAFNDKTGKFRNFMSYERKWLEQVGSEDSHGRSMWALGHAIQYAPMPGILKLSTHLFDKALPACAQFASLRANATTILGCAAYLKRFSGASEIRRQLEKSAQYLLDTLQKNADESWNWWEDQLTYDNAKLPHALIVAGHMLERDEMLERGLEALSWLLKMQINPETGYLSLVGNDGWATKHGKRAQFDQQPIDAAALVEACYDAYLLTEDENWYEAIYTAFNWFFGDNDVQEPLYDFTTGGCRDGLQKTGVNENQGAESTLSWLIALHKMHALTIEHRLETQNTSAMAREAASHLEES